MDQRDRSDLATTAASLVADARGLIAMDESTATCDKRFDAAGIPKTVEMRRAWRDLLAMSPGLSDSISGAILFDETIRQTTLSDVPFAQALPAVGITTGIKVDEGTTPLDGSPDEVVTQGLDGLENRFRDYAAMGARFAKWRAVIRIGAGIPTTACIQANAKALASYASLAQAAGIVPIVEPEVLMDGDHPLERCAEVTDAVLGEVFAALDREGVALDGMLLKPNMVLPGKDCADQSDTAAIARATLDVLSRRVPKEVPGIAFLSGGQSPQLASDRLNAMNVAMNAAPDGAYPWKVTFSYSRALQEPALEAWKGDAANVEAAQQALLHRARCNRAATAGRYDAQADAPQDAAGAIGSSTGERA